MLACSWDAQAHQVSSSEVRGVLLAAVQELHGLTVPNGAGSALFIWLQPLIKQALGFLRSTAPLWAGPVP